MSFNSLLKRIISAILISGVSLFAAVDLTLGINYSYTPDMNSGTIKNLNFDVLNNGTEDAGSFIVSVRVIKNAVSGGDYWDISSFRINSLKGNHLMEISYSSPKDDISLADADVPSGIYALAIFIDPEEEVNESNESNNYYFLNSNNTFTFDNSSSPDIDLKSVTSSNFTINPQELTLDSLTFSIENSGASAAGTFKIKIIAEEKEWGHSYNIFTYEIGSMGSNSFSKYSFLNEITLVGHGMEAGEYKLVLIIDPDNDIEETDEENNRIVLDNGKTFIYNGDPSPVSNNKNGLMEKSDFIINKVSQNIKREVSFQIVSQFNQQLSLSLYDISGKVVSKLSKHYLQKGDNRIKLSNLNLSGGYYILSLSNNKMNKNIKFLIK